MGIWAWVLPLLLQLLSAFLQVFLQKWLNPQPGRALPADLSSGKNAFMAKVAWKWWYGPYRLLYASQLYDKANARFVAGKYAVQLSSADACNKVASALCDGLTLED